MKLNYLNATMRKPTLKESVDYVVSSYSFACPQSRRISGTDFADIITRRFDIMNPVNAEASNLARRYVAWITNGIQSVKYNYNQAMWED